MRTCASCIHLDRSDDGRRGDCTLIVDAIGTEDHMPVELFVDGPPSAKVSLHIAEPLNFGCMLWSAPIVPAVGDLIDVSTRGVVNEVLADERGVVWHEVGRPGLRHIAFPQHVRVIGHPE